MRSQAAPARMNGAARAHSEVIQVRSFVKRALRGRTSCSFGAQRALSTRKAKSAAGGATRDALLIDRIRLLGSLDDDLRGLVQCCHRERREHGAGGDQGVELGHRSNSLKRDRFDEATLPDADHGAVTMVTLEGTCAKLPRFEREGLLFRRLRMRSQILAVVLFALAIGALVAIVAAGG